VTELEEVYQSADENYRKALALLGDSVLLVQDLIDLYQRIAETVSASPLAVKNEHVMGVKFMMASRYYLTTGVIDCLRCHQKDTDHCAKQTHPSIYSFAGRSTTTKTDTAYMLEFGYFQAEPDGSAPAEVGGRRISHSC